VRTRERVEAQFASTVVLLEIALLIGAAEYRVSDVQARRLEQTIRRRCIDEHGHPLDEAARACLQLADVLAEDFAAGVNPEPIELLGRSHVEGLCEYVLEEEDVAAVEGLTDLCDALKRYRGK
jgi:hypothetical protein